MHSLRPLLVAFSVTATPFLLGQTTASLPAISGTVLDPTGAAVEGATVSVVAERTGHNLTGQTNSSGHYEFSRLPSGHYILKIRAAGFQTFVASDAQVTPAQPLRIDAKLSIGSASSTVQVSAAERPYAALENSAGTRTPSPLLEVPQSIEVLGRTLIRDQDRRTLADALVNVSGVTPTKPEEILFTQPLVRGFPAEVYTDGLSMFGNTTTANDPTSLVGTEQIDVVKGPNSTMYGGGLGSPLGGLINVVSVRPGPTLGGYIGLRGGNFGTFDPYGDINVPLNSRIAARLSGEYQRNDSWVDVVSGDRWSLQPAMSFQFGPQTNLFVQGRFNHRDQLEYSGVPAVQAMDGEIDRKAFVGAPVGQPHTRLDNRMATVELNHEFSDNLRWNTSARYYFSQANEHGSFVLPAFAPPDPATPTVYAILTLDMSNNPVREGTFDSNLFASVRGFGGRHGLLAGVSYDHTNFYSEMGFSGIPVGTEDLAHPTYNLKFGPPTPADLFQTDRYQTTAVYGQDQATYGRLSLTGSVRYTKLDFRERQQATDKSYNHASGRIGGTFRVANGVALYAAYATAFRGAFGLVVQQAPKPETSRNVEGGLKLALNRAHLAGTLAVFNQTRNNVATTDPNNFLYSIQTGQQRARGAEADVTWEPLRAFSLLANYAYTQATVTQDNAIPVGDFLQRVPRNSGRVAGRYRIQNGTARGLSFGAGVTAFTRRQTTLPNTVAVPGYAAVDAQAAYDFGRYTLQGSAVNLTARQTFDPYQYFGFAVVMPNQPISGYDTLKGCKTAPASAAAQTVAPPRPLAPPADESIPVAFLLSEGAVVIDFCGPWEVFLRVPKPKGTFPAFKLYTVAETTDPIRTSDHGFKIVPDFSIANAPQPKVIVVPAQSAASDKVKAWIREASKQTDVTMSVCTGAFVLASTGLLSGKPATTHHGAYSDFAEKYLEIKVQRGARFVETGNLATVGGLTSGMDLALRVVQRYFGEDAVRDAANMLEYQGDGWQHPESNAEFAKPVLQSAAHPRCAVCGMDPDRSLASVYKGKTYYFCMREHKKLFDKSPETFLAKSGGAA